LTEKPFATRRQGVTDKSKSKRPIIRLISIDGSTLATSGKSIVIGTVDDPNSNHQFELDATVTRLK
jgi:hypothetical protein